MVKIVARLCAAVLSGLLFNQSALANSTFYFSDDVEVMYIDGQPIDYLAQPQNAIALGSTAHEVVLRFKSTINRARTQEVIQSEPVVIALPRRHQDIYLRSALESDASASEVRAFYQQPVISFTDAQGEILEINWFLLPPKFGFQLTRNYLEEIRHHKTQIGWSQEPQLGKTDKYTVTLENPAVSQPSEQRNAELGSQKVTAEQKTEQPKPQQVKLEQLQRLFLQADEATRKAFQIWLIDQ